MNNGQKKKIKQIIIIRFEYALLDQFGLKLLKWFTMQKVNDLTAKLYINKRYYSHNFNEKKIQFKNKK